MIPYRKGFFPCKAHKARDYVYRLFAVAVRERIINGIVRDFLTLAPFILGVAVIGLIEIHLADIVKKCAQSDSFFAVIHSVKLFRSVTFKIIFKAMIHVKAVLDRKSVGRERVC